MFHISFYNLSRNESIIHADRFIVVLFANYVFINKLISMDSYNNAHLGLIILK